MTKFDAAYFIGRFEPIPEEQWGTGAFDNRQGRKCSYGHLGVPPGGRIEGEVLEEARALTQLFLLHGLDVLEVNDRRDPRFNEPNPRGRILSALRWIKAQEPKPF